MQLWLVGQYKGKEPWEFQGVFDSEDKAIGACKTDMYFIAPFILNEEIPFKTKEWPGVYYPKHSLAVA